jgi:hydrogenase maturation protease
VVNAINIAVVGLGNILLSDEGAGVRIVEELQDKYSFSPPVKIIDGGTLGFGIINEIEHCKKLIIVDAVKAGEKPGTVYRFTRDDLTFDISRAVSAHDVGFLEVLEQWKVIGFSPEVIFFGIEPQDISNLSMELSDCVQEQVPKLVGLLIEELQKNGIEVYEK